MENLLFDPTEYTDDRVRAIMEGKTCRTCYNRVQLSYGRKIFSYCNAIFSGRTTCKRLKVKTNQPACIRYANKDDTK